MAGGWIYIMADRYRGTMYFGVAAHLAARVAQHRTGRGSLVCAEYGMTRLVWSERVDDILDGIAHEKRLKHGRRDWKFALIERGNPDWFDLYDRLA